MRTLTSSTHLENLKLEAKRWLKALRADDTDASGRFLRAHPKHDGTIVLRDVQHALAREFGFDSWKALKEAVEGQARSRTREAYEQAARDFPQVFG